MAVLSPYGPQFLDTSVSPATVAAGCKLYTYLTGTTTNQAAYKNQAGSAAHTNPITLDSSGYVTDGALWLAAGVEYRFRLETAAGALIWQMDDIYGVSDDASSSYLTNNVNVFEYIPVAEHAAILAGTSTYNASTAIINAITACVAMSGPVRLVFETGKYKCDARLGSFTGKSDFTIDFNGATLDFSSLTSASYVPLLELTGSYGTPVSLTANAAAEQSTISVDSSGFAAGDWVKVYSSKRWDVVRTGTKIGELNQIDTVPDAASVTVATPLQSLYQADTGLVHVTVTAGGSGYTNLQAVTLDAADASGTGGAGVAIVSGGAVTDVIVTTAGSGYTQGETVNITVGGSGATGTAGLGAAKLQKITMCRNVHIKNGTIIGPGHEELYGGIILIACVESSISNMNTRDFAIFHHRLTDCALSRIYNCDMHEAYEDSQAYGVTVADATQDCQIVNCTMREVRHAFTTNNNTTTNFGITRRIRVAGCQVFNNIPNVGGTSGDALDTHAGADTVIFDGNTVQGAYGIGINAECRRLVAIGNVINGSTSVGIRHVPYCDLEAETLIVGNSIIGAGDNTGTNDYGIRVALTTSAVATIGKCVISGNNIASKNDSISMEGASTTYKISNFSVTGNVTSLISGLSDSTNTGVVLTYAQHGTLSSNRIKARNAGVIGDTLTHVVMSANAIEIDGSSGSTGFGVRLQGTNSYCGVTGNTAYYSNTGITTTVGVSFGGTTTYSGAWNNVTQGFGTNVSVGAGTGVASANNI